MRHAALLPVLLAPSLAAAAQVHVPADYSSLQAAIDAARPGDEVVVAPGNYTGPFVIRKQIIVQSSAGAARTTLSGAGAGPVVLLEAENGQGGTLAGFTVSGGSGLNGGGLFLSGDVAVLNCVVENNTAGNGGGAFLVGTPLLSGVRFEGNSGEVGGGVFVAPDADVLIDSCEFVGNQATFGGGVFLSPASQGDTFAVVGASSFENNQAHQGGGVMAVMSGFEATGSSFVGNVAWSSGGALRLIETTATSVADSEFRDNEADGRGGAACLTEGGSLVVTGSELAENQAQLAGGGLETDSMSELAVGSSSLWWNEPNDIEGDWTDLGDNSFSPPVDPPLCAADVSAPFGVLDVQDVMGYVSLFFVRDPAADLAAPAGVIDLRDIIYFVNLYMSGCAQ